MVAAGFTVRDKFWADFWLGELLSVTTMASVNWPAAVGVPEIAPVVELMVRPSVLVSE